MFKHIFIPTLLLAVICSLASCTQKPVNKRYTGLLMMYSSGLGYHEYAMNDTTALLYSFTLGCYQRKGLVFQTADTLFLRFPDGDPAVYTIQGDAGDQTMLSAIPVLVLSEEGDSIWMSFSEQQILTPDFNCRAYSDEHIKHRTLFYHALGFDTSTTNLPADTLILEDEEEVLIPLSEGV